MTEQNANQTCPRFWGEEIWCHTCCPALMYKTPWPIHKNRIASKVSWFLFWNSRGRPQSIMHCITWSKCLQNQSKNIIFSDTTPQGKTFSWPKDCYKITSTAQISLDQRLSRATIQCLRACLLGALAKLPGPGSEPRRPISVARGVRIAAWAASCLLGCIQISPECPLYASLHYRSKRSGPGDIHFSNQDSQRTV